MRSNKLIDKSKKHKTPLSKIRQHVYAWERSGLTQAAYALKMGYTKGSVGRWVHRIKRHDESSSLQAASTKPHLRPVEISGPTVPAQYNIGKELIEIILNDKMRVLFSVTVETRKITELLRELQSCN